MLLLKKTKALEESYEYLYEHNRPVFVKLKAEPDNPYDRNAIAVTGNLRGGGGVLQIFFSDGVQSQTENTRGVCEG